MHPHAGSDPDRVRLQIRDHLKTLFNIEDSSSVEIFVMLQRVAHLSRMLDDQPSGDLGLSGPRWRLLLRLRIEEVLGNRVGLTPTILSHSQHVSKNTISALLRGLEAQGLIQRALDSADLRAFRIQLTQAGRDYLHATTPRRLEGVNRLLSGLDAQEQKQLIELLEKLHRSLSAQYHPGEEDSYLVAESESESSQ